MNLKQMVQNAIPGWDGRLAGHHVGYNANGQVHPGMPYTTNANDPKVIQKRVQLMKDFGFDVLIDTYQGPWSSSCQTDIILTAEECGKQGMEFALLLDPGGMKKWTSATPAQITANVEAALSEADTTAILRSSTYVPEGYVLDFNTGADLVALAAKFPTLKFLKQGAGFSWPTIDATITDSSLRNAASVASLKSQHTNAAMEVASFCLSFDDSGQAQPVGVSTVAAWKAAGAKQDFTSSAWGGPARRLESFGGMFAQQQLATISATVPMIALVTITDYNERSSGPFEVRMSELQGVNWAAL